MYMFWRIDVSTVRNPGTRLTRSAKVWSNRKFTIPWNHFAMEVSWSWPIRTAQVNDEDFLPKITLTFLKLALQEDFDGSHIKATQSCVMILCPKPPLGNWWKRHFDEVEVFETHCCLRDVGWIRCAGLVDQHDPALVAITLQTGVRLSNPSSVELLVILSQTELNQLPRKKNLRMGFLLCPQLFVSTA